MKLPLICSGAYPTCSLEESLTYSTLSWPSTTNMNPVMEHLTKLRYNSSLSFEITNSQNIPVKDSLTNWPSRGSGTESDFMRVVASVLLLSVWFKI